MESSGPRFERRPDEADTITDDDSLGKLVTQVSENASALIREEIELAKAEVEEKVRRLAMGAVVAGVAGFFVLIGLIFVFQTIAWAITDAFFSHDIWAGFLITTLLLFGLAALGGFIAYRSFQAGAPPVPDQAIEEAKLIREALEHPDVQAAAVTQRPAEAQTAAPTPTSAPTPTPAPAPEAAPRPSQAEKAAEQAEKKQAKQAAKEAKAAEKQAAKEAKAAEKQAAKARREAEKQAAKAEVEATKARREAQKQADKAAAEAEKAKREAEQQAEKARKAADKQAAKDAKKKNKGEN